MIEGCIKYIELGWRVAIKSVEWGQRNLGRADRRIKDIESRRMFAFKKLKDRILFNFLSLILIKSIP